MASRDTSPRLRRIIGPAAAMIRGRLLLASVLCAAACGGSERESRLLIVGWDGATFDLLDPLVEAGRMPNLAALLANGRSATLESTRIPISSAAWPTLATGKGPGEHGVYSFFRQATPESYDVRLVSAIDVAEPPIWRTLSRRDRIVHVWGVPLTFPPEPVNGTLVAGMLSPFEAEYAHPRGLAAELRATGFVPDVGVWRESQVLDVAAIERQLDLKEREVNARLVRRDWSFAMVVFKSLDVLCHRPAVDLRGPEVTRLLERLDAILGTMIAAAGEDTVCMLVSDHGFATYRRAFNLHRWLLDAGYALPKEGAELLPLPEGPLAELKASERSARLAQLDLGATRALASVCEGNYGSIRLNVVGREPNGTVERADVDAVLDALERDLMAVEFPAGVPVVRRVSRASTLYPGPHQDAVLPDLIVELAPEWRCVAATFGPALAVGQAAFPDHALDGIFALAGPGIAQAPERGRLQLVDVAPIAFHCLREPVPTSLRGDAHPEFHTSARAVARIDDADDPSLVGPEVAYRGLTATGDIDAVTSRIKGSGYGD